MKRAIRFLAWLVLAAAAIFLSVIETLMDKRRILEIYINVIERGERDRTTRWLARKTQLILERMLSAELP